MTEHPPTGARPVATSETDTKRDLHDQFDQVIEEQLARAAQLLREAAEIRTTLARQSASAEATASEALNEERQRTRTLLAAVLDDVTELQGQAERIARRLSDALDEIEELLPPPGEAEFVSAQRNAQPALPLPPEDDGTEEPPAPATDDTILIEPDESEPAPRQPVEPTSDDEAPIADDTQIDLVDSAAGALAQRSGLTLLVHGIEGAAPAIALKRHLETLPHVQSVEPRECTAGVARFVIRSEPPLTMDDLATWPVEGTVEPLHQRAGLLEARVRA